MRDREEKDYRNADRAWSKGSDVSKDRGNERERKKEDRDDPKKDKSKYKRREKDISHKNCKNQIKECDPANSVRDRAKEKSRTRDEDRDEHRDREKERVQDRQRDFIEREKERGRRAHMLKLDIEEGEVADTRRQVKGSSRGEDGNRFTNYQLQGEVISTELHLPTSYIEERISKKKEKRPHKHLEEGSDILSWVNKSRKLDEKSISDKEKALRLSKAFEEQDDINQREAEVDIAATHSPRDLVGVKVLHGLDKVIEGGAVVLTLKDQSIIADGYINEDTDVLENVEIGEQKRRDDAHQLAKKKTGKYDDRLNNDPGFQKKILPQYDDPAADEGITLDASGLCSGDAEKKLKELRKRMACVSTNNHFEDLSSSEKIVSDYYTPEEMLKFKKPKKKKSLWKKEKLDLDALEAEAVSAGLGVGDIGSRKNSNREAIRDEQERRERLEAETRGKAYKAAYAKANEASKALRMENPENFGNEEVESSVFEDDEELRKSLARARKLVLKKQDVETASKTTDKQAVTFGETQESKVVFTEMEEFIGRHQFNQEACKQEDEDMFKEVLAPNSSDREMIDKDGPWTEVKYSDKEEPPAYVNEAKNILLDEFIHEAPVGKGLSGALKMLKDRGTLKENDEWSGRNMDGKKSKLLGNHKHGDRQKEMQIVRMDEYGRIMTPKEAHKMQSHIFHGMVPGKKEQEKRKREYEVELKVQQMKNSDTPLQSVERVRQVLVQRKTPYLVLSGHVKPGHVVASLAHRHSNLAPSYIDEKGDNSSY